MVEAQTQDVRRADRKKRVQRLKKIIIVTLITAMIFPTVLSIFLLIKTMRLEKQIEELKQIVLSEDAGKKNAGDKGGRDEGKDDTEEIAAIQMEGADALSDTAQEYQETAAEIPEEEGQEEESTEPVKMRNVYLTFDDGPSVYTGDILDILKEYDVKATFFVVGKEGEKNEALYKRIVEEGHTLGMHSYSHRYKEIYASEEDFAKDFEKLQDYLYDITGVESRFYRFPGGSSNTVSKIDMSTFIDYLDTQGIAYFDWNVSSGDASSGGISVEQIIDNCVGNAEYYNNMVILMHDSQEKERR